MISRNSDRPRQRPGLRVARVLELLGLDAEMRRGDRVIGVEIGVRGEAEQPDGQLRIRRVGRDRIDDRDGSGCSPIRPSQREAGDPAPVLEEGGLVARQPVGREGVGAEVPDAVHPERGVAGVELLAQRVEFHRGVVGRDDAFLHRRARTSRRPRRACRARASRLPLAGSTKLLP